MNVKLATAFGAALIAASTSFAQASEYQDFSGFVSTRSRAEVIAERDAARADGTTLRVLDGVYPVIALNPNTQRSRQEVVAELRQFSAQHANVNTELDYPAAYQASPMRARVARVAASAAAR